MSMLNFLPQKVQHLLPMSYIENATIFKVDKFPLPLQVIYKHKYPTLNIVARINIKYVQNVNEC